MSDEMIDDLREWLTMAEAERDEARAWARLRKRAAKRHRAKSAERLAVIESLLYVIGAAETTGNAIISSELWKRVEHARKAAMREQQPASMED